MRASATVTASLALIALLVMGFSVTVRVCGASVARASDLQPTPESAPLVMAIEPPDVGAETDVVRTPEGTAEASTDADDGTVADGDAPSARTERGGTGLELHELTVWSGSGDSPQLYVSFAPVSIESLFERAPVLTAVVGDEEIEVADVAPSLDIEHVRVLVDGEPVNVSGLEWYYAGYSDLSGADTRYMPVCLLNIVRPAVPEGTHTISVRIEDVGTGAVGEGEATFECEGWDQQL